MLATLHQAQVERAGDRTIHRCRLTYAPGTLPPADVSFEVEPASMVSTKPSVLPLLPSAIVLACRTSQDLRVDEALPQSIHDGARHVAQVLHEWYGWHPAALYAPVARPARRLRPWGRRPDGVGLFFTRGVDSWGALLDLRSGPSTDRPTHLITVDNELHLDPSIRQAQIRQTRAVADELGLPLVVVRTDVRAATDPHTDWGTDTHGAVLAGIGLLLRSSLRRAVIAPTHWDPMLRPWGSHPDLDPAWSVPGLEVVHHDGSEPRWRRVERIIADPLAAATLQVCWQGSERNCGRCEKCLRLMTSLVLLGRQDLVDELFEAAFDPQRIGPELHVSPHPWCDTMDHLDHVGLAADPLRERWELAERAPYRGLSFETRAIQPRLPLDADGATAGQVDVLARHLAQLGLRIRRLPGGGPPGPAVVLADAAGQAVVQARRADGSTGSAVPVGRLERSDLADLLRDLHVDLSTLVPFDPGGQDPPPPSGPVARFGR